MTAQRHHTTDTEAVALFHDVKSLQAAIDELLTSGFDREDLSVLASKKTIEDKLGHGYGSTRDLEDNPDAPRAPMPPLRASASRRPPSSVRLSICARALGVVVIASGGTLLGGWRGGIAGGGGATVGTALAGIVGHEHAKHLNEHLDRGGLLLWVRTRDVEAETKALDVSRRHSGQDVHLHPAPSA